MQATTIWKMTFRLLVVKSNAKKTPIGIEKINGVSRAIPHNPKAFLTRAKKRVRFEKRLPNFSGFLLMNQFWTTSSICAKTTTPVIPPSKLAIVPAMPALVATTVAATTEYLTVEPMKMAESPNISCNVMVVQCMKRRGIIANLQYELLDI